MAKCLCKLKIFPIQINLSCPWHGQLKMIDPVICLQSDGIWQIGKLVVGRWKCPVCGQWVNKDSGWRPYLYEAGGGVSSENEEICLRCYHHFQALVVEDGKIRDPA